ncbi:hypothetical protein B4113_0967 [Geobacillus sp. B4113_201601]|nr:hypothetical protein B4113_0967 [Geobacillus sp. B4113_201601]
MNESGNGTDDPRVDERSAPLTGRLPPRSRPSCFLSRNGGWLRHQAATDVRSVKTFDRTAVMFWHRRLPK